MTIEEKAKAYDEALEKARKHYNSKYYPSEGPSGVYLNNADLEEIFPVLKESEDERIRKSIIRLLQVGGYMPLEDKEKAFAYLEKQKEKSMSATEVLVKAGLKPYKDGNQWCVLAGDNIQEGICGFGDTVDEALYQFLMEVLERQEEQKPVDDKAFEEWIDDWWKHNKVNNPDSYDKGDEIQFDERGFKNFCRGIRNMYAKQRPAEWSEEDKKALNSVLSSGKTVLTESNREWLKSLPERFNPQLKQELDLNNRLEEISRNGLENAHTIDFSKEYENSKQILEKSANCKEWSEEDEEALREVKLNFELNHDDMTPTLVGFYERFFNKLKSLRPQPYKEIYQAAKYDLAIKFMNYLDENRPEGKMSLSNGECEDIDKAFKENDWAKILRYAEKYGKKN